MIKIVFRYEGYIEPNIGDEFIIRKPHKTSQRPGWSAVMDLYDNAVITITGIGRDPTFTGKMCWCASIKYKEGAIIDEYLLNRLNSYDYMFNYRWLEKFSDSCLEEIDDSLSIDFFDI